MLKIKFIETNKLKANRKNPRKHTQKQIEMLEKSIEWFGWVNPIIVDKNYNILAGHLRYEVAKKKGIEKVPVIVTDLEGEDAEAYMIIDNKIAEEAKWDYDKLGDVLSNLKKYNYNDLGFRVNVADLFDDDRFEEIEVEKVGGKDEFMYRGGRLMVLRFGNYGFFADDERIKKLVEIMKNDEERAKLIERRIIVKLAEVYDELIR